MELSRQALIDRCQSKVASIEEFNYDMLTAPPLNMMLSTQDIDQLHYIATSVKYSGNPRKKYAAMDAIMRSRGFVKLSAGTNRVVYRHLESTAFVIKVAADAIGIGDNPKEFKNQFIFKPFVTKVFEVSPCGTVGVFERVNPITSREEFLSVADDIYEVITDWFIGKYIMADIGTKFFMNWGIRTYSTVNDGSVAFGPVLLDFPYVYELDGNKLICTAIDYNSPNGVCGGEIDYDDGFNFLRCTKCGVRYRVRQLAKNIEENKIKINKAGRTKNMRIGHYNKDGQVISNSGIFKPEEKKVNIIEASDKPVGNAKVSLKNYNTNKTVEEKATVEEDTSVVRGIVKAPETTQEDKSTNSVVEKELKKLNSNLYEFDSYESEYDLLTLRCGDNIITTKLHDIIPEEEIQSIVENSELAEEYEEIMKEIEFSAHVNEEKGQEIKRLKAEINRLKVENDKLAAGAPKVVINGIPNKVNETFVDVDSSNYGDAITLDGLVDDVSYYTETAKKGRNVIVFPTNPADNEFMTSADGKIIVVSTINGYLIDDLLEKVAKEEKKEEPTADVEEKKEETTTAVEEKKEESKSEDKKDDSTEAPKETNEKPEAEEKE